MKKVKIKGFERYFLYEDGSVYDTKKDCYLKQGKASGYPSVNLITDKGEHKCQRIHRLLGLHFIKNPDNFQYVCHVDGDPENNCLKNLYWGTGKMNRDDLVRHGREIKGENTYNAKLTEDIVKKIRKEYNGKYCNLKSLADKYKVSLSCVFNVVHFRTWKHVT